MDKNINYNNSQTRIFNPPLKELTTLCSECAKLLKNP